MTYTLYQGTRLGIALKEALEEMEVILKAFLSFLILFSVSRLKVLSSEMDLAERSSLKSEARRFSENRSVPHPVRAL
jgi:hypothetical protein